MPLISDLAVHRAGFPESYLTIGIIGDLHRLRLARARRPIRVRPDHAHQLAHGIIAIAGRIPAAGQRPIHRQHIAHRIIGDGAGRRQAAIARGRRHRHRQQVVRHIGRPIADGGPHLQPGTDTGTTTADALRRAGQLPDRRTSHQSPRRALIGGAGAALLVSSTASAGSTTFHYDAVGRLIAALYPDGALAVYEYDNANNRKTQKNPYVGTFAGITNEGFDPDYYIRAYP